MTTFRLTELPSMAQDANSITALQNKASEARQGLLSSEQCSVKSTHYVGLINGTKKGIYLFCFILTLILIL